MPDLLEAVLDNGLKVLIRESRLAPVATCWAGYRVGSRNERPGITGASHWVEHMTFKGTTELAKGDVFRRTARYGGNNNGFTTHDFTVYYETLPAAQLEVALHIESQRMHAALFDREETESERTVILAEREGGENNPHFQLGERMSEAIFRDHPYRWPIIGARADLERLTPDELRAHYDSYYVPNNAVLAIVGDVDAESTLTLVERWFGKIPRGAAPPPQPPRELELTGEQRVEVRRPGSAAYLHLAYRAPSFSHPDFYPLVMADAVLSGSKGIGGNGGYMGRTARVYRALVESRLAANAGSSYRSTVEANLFGGSLTLRDGVNPAEAEAALVRTLEGLVETPPTEEELARTLRQAEAQFAYGQDGVSGQAFALLQFELLGDRSRLDAHLDHLRSVTPQDVARVAAAYLRPENRTVGWFLPDPSATGAPGGTATAAAFFPAACYADGRQNGAGRLDPRREVLDNGIVLLSHESHGTPSVAIRGTFPAGAAREAPGQEGLASFTARLLRRGTRDRDALAISEAVEEIGASFAIWGGTEEAGFSAKCLGRDLETVLEVLGEVLGSPAFAEAEIEKTRGEIRTQFREQEDSTRARADLALYERLYPGGHPYGRSALGVPSSVESFSSAEFAAFHQAYYGTSGMKVSIAGTFDRERVRRCLECWLPGRQGLPEQEPWIVTPCGAPQEARISMSHKSQVDLVMGGPGIPRHHPDFFALSMVTMILGSLGMMGRLGQHVRDELGLAYHVSSRSVSRLWSGEWLIQAGLNSSNVDRAMAAIRAEVERIRREPLSEQELSDAQEYLIGSLPLRLETNDGVAGYLLNAEYYGLGLDYLQRYPGYIRAETRQSLQAAAVAHLDPEKLSAALAGPVPA